MVNFFVSSGRVGAKNVSQMKQNRVFGAKFRRNATLSLVGCPSPQLTMIAPLLRH